MFVYWLKNKGTPPPRGSCVLQENCVETQHMQNAAKFFFSQVAKKKNIHTEELSSVCNHQRTKIPPVTMCIIHRKNINFGCNLLQHKSVPKNILSVCNQQRTKISPPTPPPKPPPCHNVHHPPKNTNFGFNLLQHTSVPKNILSVCNQQRTKKSPPHPPPQNPPLSQCASSTEEHQSTLVLICYNTHLYRRTSCLFAINNERKYPPPPPLPKTPPRHNVHHPPKNINFGCNLLQHTHICTEENPICLQSTTNENIPPPTPPPPHAKTINKTSLFLTNIICRGNQQRTWVKKSKFVIFHKMIKNVEIKNHGTRNVILCGRRNRLWHVTKTTQTKKKRK